MAAGVDVFLAGEPLSPAGGGGFDWGIEAAKGLMAPPRLVPQPLSATDYEPLQCSLDFWLVGFSDDGFMAGLHDLGSRFGNVGGGEARLGFRAAGRNLIPYTAPARLTSWEEDIRFPERFGRFRAVFEVQQGCFTTPVRYKADARPWSVPIPLGQRVGQVLRHPVVTLTAPAGGFRMTWNCSIGGTNIAVNKTIGTLEKVVLQGSPAAATYGGSLGYQYELLHDIVTAHAPFPNLFDLYQGSAVTAPDGAGVAVAGELVWTGGGRRSAGLAGV